MENTLQKAGAFLAEYYNGYNNGITGIYRIGEVWSYDYTAWNILHSTESGYLLPSGINFKQIGKRDDKLCFLPISYDEVKSMIIDLERKDMVKYIMSIPHGVSGVKNEDLLEFWSKTTPAYSIASTYHRWKRKNENDFKIIRVLENGVVTYEPIGNFKFWGHTYRKLEIVG